MQILSHGVHCLRRLLAWLVGDTEPPIQFHLSFQLPNESQPRTAVQCTRCLRIGYAPGDASK